MKQARKARFFFAMTSLLAALAAPALASPQSPAPTKVLPASPSKADQRQAKRAFERGVKAEEAKDWPAAFDAYAEAARFNPLDKETLLRRELARFRIVQQHTDVAERAAIAGRLDRAREELRAALALDPGYSVARERLAQLLPAPNPAQGLPNTAPVLPSAETEPPGPVQLQPQGGTREFNYHGDTRGAFEEVARQFGVVASFDADLPQRPARLRVSGVDFTTAMTLVARQTKTFWRPLDARTFFVTEDTAQKRQEYAPIVVRTVVLPASTTTDKMTETVRLLRDIAGITHTQLDTRSRTLTLRDRPENVAVAMALLKELEQARPELLLDIDILEVNRNVARQLGTNPPTTSRLITFSDADIRAIEQAQNFSALLAIAQRIFGTSVPPLVAFGGGRTTFVATLPGATATFAKTLSMVRSGRRVLLRAEEGQATTFFVGERFPVALALLGASISQGVLNPATGQLALPRTDFRTGVGPAAVATASFRNNGILDLAVANQGSVATIASSSGAVRAANVVTITTTSPHGLGTGQGVTISGVSDSSFNGTFTIATATSATSFTYAQTGPNASSGGGTVSTANVSILLGNGDGTFAAKTDFATGAGPVAIAVANFTSNLDTNLDLAVANQTDGTVSILTGNGDGTFNTNPALVINLGSGSNPSAIVAGDFNGDGLLDLAVAEQGKNAVAVLLGDGTGKFTPTPSSPITVGTNPSALIAADVDGDGKLDLVVANQGTNDVSILIGKGDAAATFTPAAGPRLPTGKSPVAVVAGDFNGDKRTDLAVANANETDNTISLLIQNPDGTFKSAPNSPVKVGTKPVALVAEDFNLDGRLDVAVVNQGSNTVSILLGNGDGSFGLRAEIATGNKPSSLINADFNRDSRPDLAITNQSDNTVSVILNTATFTSPPGGIPQTAYPGAEYEDIGLKVRATPRIHNDDEVTLQLEFEIRSLSGDTVNGIPIISNRTVQQTVRLHENEPAILSGIVSQDETRTITGTPGIARLAGFGHLFGKRDAQARDTELLIIITPRALRLASRKNRSIYAGRGETGAPRPGAP